ncbi:MAG: hypothetical protein C4K49_00720 [Candidatus Thorarchaeota archaeon]|nr:MAG: hypothetical protein C4K49_00720 [Candidatus Thorarchaeota archaeon]
MGQEKPSINTSVFMEPASATPRTVRVAIYNETDVSLPSYATVGMLSGNVSSVQTVLQAAGHQVTLLDMEDILNHRLKTAYYDVFILVDNLPRDAIVDQVQEFWLGGGGVLSLDSAISYLCYAGMIPPESEGSENYHVYWDYVASSQQVVYARHPVTKSYKVDDIFADSFDWGAFNWTALMATSISGELVRLITTAASSTWANGVAHDPAARGGRVVHLFTDAQPLLEVEKALIVDAVDWLCPRVKGRVLFDLTHEAWYGVDDWDAPVHFAGRYSIWRNDLVADRYTFDKLYPSASGNLTAENLAPYDLLVVVLPGINFTAAEVTAVHQWVNAGNGLLALGDNPSLTQENGRLNYLLSFSGLWMNRTLSGSDSASYHTVHPTIESCSVLSFNGPGLVNYSGDAYPIWGNAANSIIVAGQELDNGRIILAGDINFLANTWIIGANNEVYGINLVNWLTSSRARTLLYTDEYYSYSPYRTPVADALNDLGLRFYLTGSSSYFNLSLNMGDWDLIVVDIATSGWSGTPEYYVEVADYVSGGGRLVMCDYEVDSVPGSPLWPLLGFSFLQDMPDEAVLSIWSHDHPIFTTPNDYSAPEFVPGGLYMDDGDLLTVHPNATPVAGYIHIPDQAAIVVRNDGRTIYNGYILDQFQRDFDDSTYMDSIEIWENEIAFVMGPQVDSPADIAFEAGTVGHSINWHPTSYAPASFAIERNGVPVAFGPWDGSSITRSVDMLAPGHYTYRLTVEDKAGLMMSDTVVVTVADTTAPALDSPSDFSYVAGATGQSITWNGTELYPATFEILGNGTVVDSGTWDGSAITVSVDGLAVGSWTYTLVVVDQSGNFAMDSVVVTVTPSGFSLPGGILTLLLITAAAVGWLLALVLVVKRAKS